MSQSVICPVHGFERRKCTVRCFAARREMQRINAQLREYWYDRRRGVGVMDAGEYRVRFGPWPTRKAS